MITFEYPIRLLSLDVFNMICSRRNKGSCSSASSELNVVRCAYGNQETGCRMNAIYIA